MIIIFNTYGQVKYGAIHDTCMLQELSIRIRKETIFAANQIIVGQGQKKKHLCWFWWLIFSQIVDDSSSTPESAIVIPTALSEGVSVDMHLQPTNRQSHWSYSSGSSQASTTPTTSTIGTNSDLEFYSESYLPSVGSAGSGLSDSYLSPASTTAVNLKTGTTVLHIDWSVARKLQSCTSTSKFPKLGKSLKRSPNSKEKRGKKSLPEPSWYLGSDFLEALSITQVPGPFLNNRESAERLGQGVDSLARLHDPDVYAVLAQETHSVLRFNKLAYPDLHGSLPFPAKEPLYHRKVGVQR